MTATKLHTTRRGLGVSGAAALLAARTAQAEISPALDVDGLLQAYDAQGIHRTGHLADAENADWLVAQARDLGADVSIEEFGIDRVEPAGCYVEIEGRRVPGVPMYDAAFTGPDGIEGTFGSNDAAEIGLAALNPLAIYQPSYEAYRETKAHKALVTITKGGRPGLALFNAERFLHPYGVPDLMVSSEFGPMLEAAASRGARARVVADVRRVPSVLRNVVAIVRGRTPGARPLAVMTPRSGWWHCASERGGGIVCWLEVLRAFRDHPPAGDVTLVASSGHELGHIGLDDFMARRRALVTDASWLHFGANIGARDSQLTLQSPQDDLRMLGTSALSEAGHPAAGLSPPTQVPFGESRAIHRAGGRYLTLIGSNALFHLPEDRFPGAVDVEAVRRIGRAAGQIAVSMAG
jgi:hypothetical protein